VRHFVRQQLGNSREIPAMPVRDSGSARVSERSVSQALRLYILTLVSLTAVAWSVVGVRGLILHEPYPRNSLFVTSDARFQDFTILTDRVAHLGESDVLSRTDFTTVYPYPIPSMYAFYFFVRLFPHPLAAYLAFAVLSFVIATCLFSWQVHRITSAKLPQIAAWLTLLLGFPLLFLLDRANIEAVVWVFVLLGIVAYARDHMAAAAVLLSIAASIKIYPALLFLLFLANHKYRAFAFAIATTVAISVLALAGVGPPFLQAISGSSKSAPYLTKYLFGLYDATRFDHSGLGFVKQVLYIYKYPDLSQLTQLIGRVMPVYSLLIPLGFLLLYWFRLRHLPILNQLMAYLILFILLPYISFEYTLIYLYLAWGAFLWFLIADVVTGRVTVGPKAIQTILFSCAVIFVPLSYLMVGHSFGFGGQVKTIFLVFILLTLLRVPMPSSLFGDLPSPGPLPQ
jgi:hypothetical protein